MTTSNICTWEGSGSGNFFAKMLSIWAVPSPPSRWLVYGCLWCLPAQVYCRLSCQGVWAFCQRTSDWRKVHKCLSTLLVHLLQRSPSNYRVQPEFRALVLDQLETGVCCRTHQLHCCHGWIFVRIHVHVPEWWWCWKGLALSRTFISLLEIGRHPMTVFMISICTGITIP